MLYLLDTNMLIAASKANTAVCQRLAQHADYDILLSSIVLAEIEYGIAKSAKREHNQLVYEEIIKAFGVLMFNSQAARHYGELRFTLERKGTPIGSNDLLIAAQALAQGATLVTDNTREFSRIPDLLLENWLRD